MLTTREIASLVLIGAAVLITLTLPSFRRPVLSSVRGLLPLVLQPKLVCACLIVVAVSTASTTVAWWIGLWDWTLLKDAVVLAIAVVLPMTARSFTFKSGGELSGKLARETLGLTALLTIYLDARPLPLFGELAFQLVATALVATEAVARVDARCRPLKRPCDWLLGLMGIFLLIWTTTSYVSSPPDLTQLLRSALFNVWLPLSLLPFFYVFGFYAVAETVWTRFRAIRRPLKPRLVLAFMIGTRLRLSLLARFNGRYNNLGDAEDFKGGLQKMREFRHDLTRRDQEEAARVATLERNSGVSGVDAVGLHLDRREFQVTKSRLDFIWVCQNGQYERQGNRYWDNLTDSIVNAERHGLPSDHGFKVEVSQRGQVWRAWRRTPGGAVLGTGGTKRRSRFYFQGDAAPTSWPGDSPEWIDGALEPWPPDWNKHDGSRL